MGLDILTIVLSVSGLKLFLENAIRLAKGIGNLVQGVLAGLRGLSTQTRQYLGGALGEILLTAVGVYNLWTDAQTGVTNLSAFSACVAKGYNGGCPEN